MPWTPYNWVSTGANPGAPGPHGSSKHGRQAYDSLRRETKLTGGDRDGSSAGQPNIYSYFVQPGTTGVTSFLQLVTNSTGMLPAYPDNCTWVYSSVHDRFVIAKGFWFGLAFSTGAQPLHSTDAWLTGSGIWNPNTKLYSTYEVPTPPAPFGWGGDSNSNFGMYDPVQNAMLRLFRDGAWGNTLQVVPLGDLTTFPLATTISVGSGHPSGSLIRNWIRNVDAHSHRADIDVANRRIYCVTQSLGGLDSTSDHGWGLMRIDLNDPTKGERLRLPPVVALSSVPATPGEVVFRPQTGGEAGGGTDYICCYDSLRDQVMFPQIRGYGGEVYNTLIYDVKTSTWSVVDSNGSTGAWPLGNVFSFDPSIGAGVLTGGHGNDVPSLNHPSEIMNIQGGYLQYLWTVTPGNSTSAQSTGSATFVNARVTALTAPINVTSSIVAGVYRFNAYDGVTSSFVATVDSANASVKTANFSGLILGKTYKFTGEHRTFADTGPIGGVATRFATLSGVPVSTSSAPAGDVTAPIITLISPTSTQGTQSGIINFNYNVTDTGGVARVELRVNNVLTTNTNYDTRVLANATTSMTAYPWAVEAWDLSSNHSFASNGFYVFNAPPPPPPPQSTGDGVQAIFLNPTNTGRVGFVMWAPVPAGEEILRPGFRSAWPSATDAEIAELEAGRVREVSGTMKIEGSDDEMKARLIARWTIFNAEIQDLPDWTLEDTFWNGTAWVKR